MVVSIRFDAEPEDYIQGVNDAIKAIKDWESQTGVSALNMTEKFEDAIKGVITLGKATDKTRDEMIDALGAIGLKAEDAEDAIAAVERETGNVGRDAPRDLKRAEDAVEDLGDKAVDAGDKTATIRDKAGAVGEGLRDLGSVARDVLEGDFGSAASGAVSALGGIAGALAGGAVGGAIATALGSIIGNWIDEWNRAAEESKKRAAEVASAWIAAGQKMLDAATLNASIQKIAGDPEQLKAANDLTKKLGVDLPTAIRILAGDQLALNTLEDEYKQKLKERDELEAIIEDNRGKTSQQTRERRGELRDFIEEYETQAGIFKEASGIFDAGTKAQSDALLAYIDNAKEATVQTDNFGNKLVELPDGKQVVIDADTGQATLDVEQFHGDVDNLPKEKAVVVKGTVDLSAVTAGIRNYRAPEIIVRAGVFDRFGRRVV